MSVSILNIRKGAHVMLRNGWEAEVADNTVRQDTRVCKVYGFVTELGSVYSTDIIRVKTDAGWMPVEHTPNQNKNRQARMNMGWEN